MYSYSPLPSEALPVTTFMLTGNIIALGIFVRRIAAVLVLFETLHVAMVIAIAILILISYTDFNYNTV